MNEEARRIADLRRQAEERLERQFARSPEPPSEADLHRLLHELRVHQIELEIQNEELRDARAELEAGLARYTDLYDFAPTGYFTLARDGTILAVNLTGARLAGIERAHLLKRRLASLIADVDLGRVAAFLNAVFSGIAGASCEVALKRPEGPPVFVNIEATLSEGGFECRAAISNVTERHELQVQRDKLILDLQEAAAKIKVLSGLLPICCYCKKIRDDKGYWEQLEVFISDHSEATFSHGICSACMKERFPEIEV